MAQRLLANNVLAGGGTIDRHLAHAGYCGAAIVTISMSLSFQPSRGSP